MTAALYGNFHVWSLRKLLSQLGKNHPGVQIYHEKATGSSGDDLVKESKRQWVEGRGINWVLPNKRPEKLKDNLHDFEELMDTLPVAAVKWKSTRHLQVLFSNGTIVSIAIALNFADIERISIDKSLVGKITDQIHNAVIDELYMVFTFLEKSKIAYVYFGKRPTEKKEGEKLSALEPKVLLVDIPGPSGRAINRKLSVNCRGDLVCVWWPSSSEAAWPWSPMAADLGRMNLVILAVSSTQLDVLCHTHTDSDPIGISFSYNEANQLQSVEASQSSSGKYTLKSCIYECNQKKVQKVSTVPIQVKGNVTAQGRNHREDKLLLACDDGSLILYDDHRQLTQATKANFLSPSIISWHPTDAVVLVASSKGDIQIFDMALASIAFQLSSDYGQPSKCCKLGHFFLNMNKLERVSWACDFGLGPAPETIGCYDDLLLVFDRGPLAVIRIELGILSKGRLGPVEIVSEYIQNQQELEAVNFLNSMNWNTNGQSCFTCLTIIMDYLFRLPFTLDREACIEDALGSFYAPTRMISDVVMLQFCDPISRLARRFFHHLLRHKRFEKAFLLAVDIGAKDLFMDIHYLASDMGNEPLAEASKQRAIQIHMQEANPDIVLEGPPDYSSDEAPPDVHDTYDRQTHHGHVHKRPEGSFLYEPTADKSHDQHQHHRGHHHNPDHNKQPHQNTEHRHQNTEQRRQNMEQRRQNMEHKRHSAERRQPTVDLTQQSMEQERNNRNSSSSGRVDMGSQSEDGDRRQSAESNDKMARRLANKAANAKNQRKKSEEADQAKKNDGRRKLEVVNFGLV